MQKYSDPRHVHGVDNDDYYVHAVYKCKKPTAYDRRVQVCGTEVPLTRLKLPDAIGESCPVKLYSRSTITRELYQLICNMISSSKVRV